MRLAAQADFYIENYGVEMGVNYLKNLGYQEIAYTITARTFEPFSSNNACEKFREVLEKSGMNLLFTIYKEEIYRDQTPNDLEDNISACLQAIKLSANMGAKVMAVRPVCFRCSTSNAWEESKRLTYAIYSQVKEEADKLGVKLAFFNNTKQLCFSSGTYSYGCKAEELLELAEHFGGGIVINPVYALKTGERVEELLTKTKDKLLAFCVDDKTQRANSQGFPLFGAVDYIGLIDYLKDYESEASLVMMYTPIMNRYTDFAKDSDVIDSLTNAFHKVACLIAGKEQLL